MRAYEYTLDGIISATTGN